MTSQLAPVVLNTAPVAISSDTVVQVHSIISVVADYETQYPQMCDDHVGSIVEYMANGQVRKYYSIYSVDLIAMNMEAAA